MLRKVLAGIAVFIFIVISLACMFPVFLTEGGSGLREILSESLNTSLRLFLIRYPFVTVIAGIVLTIIGIVLPKPVKLFFLILYIGFIIYMTLLFRTSEESRGIFEFFWSYKQAIHSSYYRQEILQNMWLFVPMGATLYSMTKKRWPIMLPIILSAVIELLQYILGLGLAEVDDIISNSFGAVIGLSIAILLERRDRQTEQQHSQ